MAEADPDILAAIEKLKERVSKSEAELAQRKRAVNSLAIGEGLPPVYASVEDAVEQTAAALSRIRTDQFHGLGLATAVKAYLELRRGSNGDKTAAAEEIFDDLKRGGFDFEARDRDEAIRGLKISLGKNQAFRSVGDTGRYGLSEWYGPARPNKRERGATVEGSATPPNESAVRVLGIPLDVHVKAKKGEQAEQAGGASTDSDEL